MTTNGGSNWRDVSRGLPPDHADFTSALIRSNDILVSADGDSGGVFLMQKDGDLWNRLNLNDQSVSVLAVRGPVIFAAGFGGLMASTNSGTDWFTADNGLYPQGLPDVNAVLWVQNELFAGLNFGGVYKLLIPQKIPH